MRAHLLIVASLLATGCDLTSDPIIPTQSGRPVYQGPPSATIGDAEVTVTLCLDRFGMRVTSASGAVLLDTFEGETQVKGDDAHAYGALGATYHDTVFNTSLIEGW